MPKSKNNKNDLLFTPYLEDTEDILWMGQPIPYLLFSWRDLYLIPFSLMWGGFAIFWELMAISGDAPLLFKLWGIPFVVVGQYMIWGRFVHKFLRRRNTYYAITENRVLVLQKLWQTKMDSYYLKDLPGISLKGRDITFGFGYGKYTKGTSHWHGETGPGFYGLTDAENVYKILQREIHYQQNN